MLPETVAGRPVTELGAYAFSDHIDQKELETAMQKRHFCREDGEPAKETEEMPEKGTAVSGVEVIRCVTEVSVSETRVKSVSLAKPCA